MSENEITEYADKRKIVAIIDLKYYLNSSSCHGARYAVILISFITQKIFTYLFNVYFFVSILSGVEFL